MPPVKPPTPIYCPPSARVHSSLCLWQIFVKGTLHILPFQGFLSKNRLWDPPPQTKKTKNSPTNSHSTFEEDTGIFVSGGPFGIKILSFSTRVLRSIMKSIRRSTSTICQGLAYRSAAYSAATALPMHCSAQCALFGQYIYLAIKQAETYRKICISIYFQHIFVF